MLDLVLQGTKANLATLLQERGLITADPETEDGFSNAEGFERSWWGGTGKFTTVKATYDSDGNQLSPATYLADFVLLVRIYASLFDNDRIEGGTGEQWARSKIVKWIKDNGTLDRIGGLPCCTVNKVRLLRASDVFDWCTMNGMPGHEWAGGNVL